LPELILNEIKRNAIYLGRYDIPTISEWYAIFLIVELTFIKVIKLDAANNAVIKHLETEILIKIN